MLWKTRLVVEFEELPRQSPGTHEELKEALSEDNLCPSRGLNLTPPRYKTEVSQLEQKCW
jgi:hypothetical protein